MAGMAELQQIIRLVEQSLDEPDLDAGELAGRACLSRFHFDRLVSAALGEPPGAFRRSAAAGTGGAPARVHPGDRHSARR
jgi:transcriptional regulator GlxA family with amidase domain